MTPNSAMTHIHTWLFLYKTVVHKAAMSLAVAFKIQKECHDKCSEEEKQVADDERLARKKEEERKKCIKNKINWMALGYPDGKPPDEQ